MIRAHHFYVVLVVAILAGATTLRIADPFFVQALRLIAFDSYQKLGPATYDPELPVRIVDIDEESLSRMGQWPWPRTTMADLLTRLFEQGAAVVAFDILFSEPDRTSPEEALKLMTAAERAELGAVLADKPSHDAVFADAIGQTPTVLATALSSRASEPPPAKSGFAVAGDDPKPFIGDDFPGASRNLDILDQAAAGIGSINWRPDRDQVIRRIPLIYLLGDQYIPTLTTEALRVYQGAGTYVLKSSNASGESAFGRETGLNHIKVGAIEIPTDADSGIWLHFRPYNPDAYIPAWQILAGTNDPDEVAGRIMLVGTSAPGLLDLRATPLNTEVPGVEVHAQAIEQIIAGFQGGRSLSRPDYAEGVELAILVVLGIALGFVLPRITAVHSALIGMSVVTALVVGGWVAFDRFGLLFDPTYPAVTLFGLVAAGTTYVYRRVEQQRGEVRRAFSYYVSPTVVDEIIAHPEKLELGGVVREVTLLFCDVRDFTSLSERMTAHELTSFINSLLTPLSEIILKNRGTIDKYIGDAIMAFWNAPLDDTEHAANACRSALAMIAKMQELNEAWRRQAELAGRPHHAVRIGIGINSGDVCVGNLGSSQRFDYSAIGDNVNLASRLEGLSKAYGVPIVIGEPTMERNPALTAIELDLMRVKGRAQPTRIYTALDAFGLNGAAGERLMSFHADMLKAYRGRDWDGAEAAIAKCEDLGVVGLAALYALYRGRIAEWRQSPPPADWDGTFTATSK
ncbi:MAG: adenylate/guanylate cyclase domain-containing protein [Bauldia sp.]